jgi:tRNA1(Val) A37 N6-methylase TrmN6
MRFGLRRLQQRRDHRRVLCSCCDYEQSADRQFTAAKAAKELTAYREGRVGRTTRMLRESVDEHAKHSRSLLDIGGGIGALAFELLNQGIESAVIIDASEAYVAAAREEAARRHHARDAEVIHGDFVVLAPALSEADVVTLDRVVCCYPSFEPLLREAARLARHTIALSYPRDRWYVKAAMWLENTKRRRGSGFRTFVHPPQRLRQIVEGAGFGLASRRGTAFWVVDTYSRN